MEPSDWGKACQQSRETEAEAEGALNDALRASAAMRAEVRWYQAATVSAVFCPRAVLRVQGWRVRLCWIRSASAGATAGHVCASPSLTAPPPSAASRRDTLNHALKLFGRSVLRVGRAEELQHLGVLCRLDTNGFQHLVNGHLLGLVVREGGEHLPKKGTT